MANCYLDPNSTINWDVLLPYVLPYTRGCPDQILLHQVRLSAIEFCRRSGILHDVQQYDLQAQVTNYQLITECNYEIVRVVRVTVDQRWEYTPVTQKLPAGIGAFNYHMTSPTMIHLRRPPPIDDPKGLEVEVVVQPKQDSCVLENYLYEMWGEGIAAGAISRILMLPQTNWYDPKLAQEFSLKFRKELSRCRAEIDRAFSTSSMMKTEQWIGPGNRGWGAGFYPGWGWR